MALFYDNMYNDLYFESLNNVYTVGTAVPNSL